MTQTVKILMERDGLSREEAETLVMTARDEMLDALENADYEEAENVMYNTLGLELDYILDVL